MKATKERLSYITIILHWLIAATIIYLLATGMKYPVVHKSIGTLIILFIIIRIIWRIKEGWIKSTRITSGLEPIVARISHWVLLIGTVLLPLSGLLISIAGGYGLSIFGIELLPINVNPENTSEIIPFDKTAEAFGHISHTVISNIMIVTILLHIAGALKHHFIYKDNTLNRMLNKHYSQEERS